MTNYAVSMKVNNQYSPIFMFEGEEESVLKEFEIFETMMFENGIADTLYLSRVPDENADAVEEMMNRNLEKSKKLTEIVLAYLALPEQFNPEWN
jgi:hypothetical protein